MTVVLPSKGYHNKMEAILSDPIYRKLTDRASRIERQTAPLIKKSNISQDWSKKLASQASVAHTLYGLMKILEKDVPL
jgi:NAD-dependent DNA ligase